MFCCKHDYDSYCSLVGRSLTIASFHSYWLCFTQVPNSLNQIFQKCPPYLPISIICYFRAYSICLVFFRIKCLLVIRKLVSKALTNLMAHFIFLDLINLDHCVLLCCAYACALWVEVSRTMYHGDRFRRFIGTLYLVDIMFFCLRIPTVWNKSGTCKIMEFVCMLEKGLGR